MGKYTLYLLLIYVFSNPLFAQEKLDDVLPVRGFCIAAPKPDGVDRFVKFIHEELAPRNVNTLVLRVDYNYQYESHPELRADAALSKADVKRLVDACKAHDIRIIPQINLLGHQGGGNNVSKLLSAYPQFTEAANVDVQWYKSYCPRHPDIHKVIFALIDEITAVFEADAFHAGMDEVFYLGADDCPRCAGHAEADLFAGEVTLIRDYLKSKGKEMWIWGDRLISGKATGLGYWEASFNHTYPAVDLIPNDVVINDWHYNAAVETDVYFAKKGLNVVTCPWKNPQTAVSQLDDMLANKRKHKEIADHLQGMMHTVWTSAENFFDGYYGVTDDAAAGIYTEWNTFRTMFESIDKL